MCLKINNFLCCLSLRTGGLVIGWANLIIYLVAAIFYSVAVIVGLNLTCSELEEVLKEYEFNVPDDFYEFCGDENYKKLYLGGGIVTIIICTILAIIGYLCISGTLKRHTGKIKPLMCVLAIGIIFSIVGVIFSGTVDAAISGLIYVCLDAYLFICLYSLISKIQEENCRGYIYATSA